ncbi:MAG: hypothetical protein ACXABY_22015 [Candidatus Thorarchaeota archaeon]
MADEEKAKVWFIGDPWNLFFGEHQEPKKPTGELTISDLTAKGPRRGWDRLILERSAEEITYYRKLQKD